jgi:hypothetical protein
MISVAAPSCTASPGAISVGLSRSILRSRTRVPFALPRSEIMSGGPIEIPAWVREIETSSIWISHCGDLPTRTTPLSGSGYVATTFSLITSACSRAEVCSAAGTAPVTRELEAGVSTVASTLLGVLSREPGILSPR